MIEIIYIGTIVITLVLSLWGAYCDRDKVSTFTDGTTEVIALCIFFSFLPVLNLIYSRFALEGILEYYSKTENNDTTR